MKSSLFALAVTLLSTNASGYVTSKSQHNGVDLRWGSLPMKFNIHGAAAPGVTAAATQAAVRAAYAAWADVSCSTYNNVDLGVVNNEWGSNQDGVNTNTWVPGWPSNYSSSALGITLTQYEAVSGKINDADTRYNPNHPWSTTGSPYAIDVQSVATHEIGHQLGLDHPPVPGATMFYATGQGDTSQRSLHSDDIAGICHLYPSGSQPTPECTKPEDCAPNETCSNNKCVVTGQKGYGGPCAAPEECISGLCLLSAGNNFCSQSCASSACPNGDKCISAQSTNGDLFKVCYPNSANAGQPLGAACQNSTQCKSEICVSVPGQGYLCSQRCNLNPDNCPDGFICAPSNVGGLCIPDPSKPPDPPDPPDPPPPAKMDLGVACDNNNDCQSALCGSTSNGKFCTRLCDDEAPCPDGFDCMPVSGSDKGACMVKGGGPAPGKVGASCKTDDECDSEICVSGSDGDQFCTILCSPDDEDSKCPKGFHCVGDGKDNYACAPIPEKKNDDDENDGGGSGCALVGSGPGHLTGLLLLLAVVLLLRRRRRCR